MYLYRYADFDIFKNIIVTAMKLQKLPLLIIEFKASKVALLFKILVDELSMQMYSEYCYRK